MREILHADQPCILCGQSLLIVVIYRDDDTGEERIERTSVPHNDEDCLSFTRLYKEYWPASTQERLL